MKIIPIYEHLEKLFSMIFGKYLMPSSLNRKFPTILNASVMSIIYLQKPEHRFISPEMNSMKKLIIT